MRTLQKIFLIPTFLFGFIFLFLSFFYLSEIAEIKNNEQVKQGLEIFHKNNLNFLQNISDQTKNKEVFKIIILTFMLMLLIIMVI
jgi:hypothetical protein